MSHRVRVKVCGITCSADAECALNLGADAIGINLYAPSPRSLPIEEARPLMAAIPTGKRVLVDVSTPPDLLEDYRDMGFDYFQVHFDAADSQAPFAKWSKVVGRERLWLAPRIAPGDPFPEEILDFCGTVVSDTYSKERFGGTGKTQDWAHFSGLQLSYPQHSWILAGGLSADNVIKAITQSHARYVDLSSGVESSPGKKDPKKLEATFKALERKNPV